MNTKHNLPILLEQKVHQLKTRLLNDWMNQAGDLSLYVPLQMVADEAAAVAETTSYPLLFLPSLFEEKAHALVAARQMRDNAVGALSLAA